MLSLNANPQGNATPLGGGRGGGINTSWGEGTLWSAFLFLNFNWRLITILWWFLPYIDMNQPWVDMCSPSWTPLPPHSPSHRSGSSQCTSPEHPVSCIEPGLAICFTYHNTRFNAILSNHPTLAFSHRVQKSILYICVSFAVLHIESSSPSF